MKGTRSLIDYASPYTPYFKTVKTRSFPADFTGIINTCVSLTIIILALIGDNPYVHNESIKMKDVKINSCMSFSIIY